MKQFLIRWYLLNKRLFKKPVFVAILCIVPLLILALGVTTAHTDGFVKITLALEDPDDPVARQMTDMLMDSSGIVHFSMASSPEDAVDRVRYGEAGGAWIFRADLMDRIHDLIHDAGDKKCVRIVEREETVALRLAREKLASVLSSESSFELMCQEYAQRVSPDFDVEVMREYYRKAVGTGEIFEFRYASGELIDDADTSYLMLPIRGVLATAILLCGLAMAMFWIRDEEQMVFCRIPRAAQPAFELGYHLTGILDVAAVVLVSLYAAGMGGSLLRELISLLVYCMGSAVFVIFVRRLLRKSGRIAAVTPIIVAAMIVINPILFNLPFVHPLRVLTPVHYYLQANHNPAFILYGTLYFIVLGAIDYLLLKFSQRIKKNPSASR